MLFYFGIFSFIPLQDEVPASGSISMIEPHVRTHTTDWNNRGGGGGGGINRFRRSRLRRQKGNLWSPRRCCAIARLDEIPSCCWYKREKKFAKKYDCKSCRRRKKQNSPRNLGLESRDQTCDVFGLLGESLLRDWMQFEFSAFGGRRGRGRVRLRARRNKTCN